MNLLLKRIVLGVPVLLPAYAINIVVVWALNSVLHLSAIGIISTVVIGDVVAYVGNVMLTPYLLIYFKRTGYFSPEDLR